MLYGYRHMDSNETGCYIRTRVNGGGRRTVVELKKDGESVLMAYEESWELALECAAENARRLLRNWDSGTMREVERWTSSRLEAIRDGTYMEPEIGYDDEDDFYDSDEDDDEDYGEAEEDCAYDEDD